MTDDRAPIPRTADDGVVRGAPSDNTTMSTVLEDFEQRGFEAQFVPCEGGAVECGACGAVSPAGEFEVLGTRRLEGASDPDDLATVIAASCPQCASCGTLVLMYGPMASDIDADVAAALPTADAAASADPDAPGSSMSREGDAVEPNEPS